MTVSEVIDKLDKLLSSIGEGQRDGGYSGDLKIVDTDGGVLAREVDPPFAELAEVFLQNGRDILYNARMGSLGEDILEAFGLTAGDMLSDEEAKAVLVSLAPAALVARCATVVERAGIPGGPYDFELAAPVEAGIASTEAAAFNLARLVMLIKATNNQDIVYNIEDTLSRRTTEGPRL